MLYADAIYALEHTDGYAVPFTLSNEELTSIKTIINKRYMDTIKMLHPDHPELKEEITINKYHEISSSINHKELMRMKHRNLNEDDIAYVQEMGFFIRLMEWFKDSTIIDPLGYSINIRIARPHEKLDTSPAHADAWYFSNYKEIADVALRYSGEKCTQLEWTKDDHNGVNFDVIHVWIPIYSELGLNGLLVAPGSHLKSWNYRKVKNGKFSSKFPKFQLSDGEDVVLKLLDVDPGDVVIFHDNLIHQGALNKGFETRVSLLFNIHIIDEE